MPHVPGKIGNIRDNTGLDTQDDIYALSSAGANATPTSANQVIGCVSKIVQPTATVSSVPVSAPSKFSSRSGNVFSAIDHFMLTPMSLSLESSITDFVFSYRHSYWCGPMHTD